MLCCRLIYMLSMLYVRLTIKVKVGIPESFKVGRYPHKITGSSHLNSNWGHVETKNRSNPLWNCTLTFFLSKDVKSVYKLTGEKLLKARSSFLFSPRRAPYIFLFVCLLVCLFFYSVYFCFLVFFVVFLWRGGYFYILHTWHTLSTALSFIKMSSIETGIAVDQENYQAENDLTIDAGFFGDVETSSSNPSFQSKSDSDDNNSEISSEGINNINPPHAQTDIKRDKILLLFMLLLLSICLFVFSHCYPVRV